MHKFMLVLAILLVICCVPSPAGAQDDCPACVVTSDARYVAIPAISLYEPVEVAPIVNREHQVGTGVAWLEGTAWIDYDWARIVLAGHSPGVFDRLDEVLVGDVVIVWDAAQVEVYEVVLRLYTTPDDVSWLMPTSAETLTLITCSGARRLIVHAEKLGG